MERSSDAEQSLWQINGGDKKIETSKDEGKWQTECQVRKGQSGR